MGAAGCGARGMLRRGAAAAERCTELSNVLASVSPQVLLNRDNSSRGDGINQAPAGWVRCPTPDIQRLLLMS